MTASEPGSSALDGGQVCLLITGAPGAGKTTVAGGVARSLSRSAVINGDAVGRLVVGGHVWPLGEPRPEAARQIALANANICSLARNFVDAKFTPVIDWIVPDAAQLEVYRRHLGSRLRLVVLDPGAETCVARNLERPQGERFVFDGHVGLRESMWKGFGSRGWWLDSTSLDAESTVDTIVRQAYDRAIC